MNHQPLRSSDIRERNEKIILGLIRSRKTLSQSEAVALTGLRAPSAFRIFSELERKGFIRPASVQAEGEERKGRRPQFYEVVPDAFSAIGIDFWAGSATVAVCDFAGTVVYSDEQQFARSMDADGLLESLEELIDRAYAQSRIQRGRVLGFGIGAPGRIDLDRGRILHYPRIAGLDDYPLSDHLSHRYGVPAYLHNNAALVALAEQRYGAAAEARSLLSLLVRSGVGGAYLENGKPLTVLGRTAMEVGHMSLDCEGPPCSCGGRGCLEAYIAEEGILSFVPAKFGAGSMSDLEGLIASGNAEFLAALEEPLKVFQVALRNLYTLFAPECFLIVGRSAAYAELLADRMRGALSDLTDMEGKSVRFLADRYDPERIGRGAADLVFERFLG